MRRADREVTDVDGMIDIIDHCKVCHIALMDGEWPYIVAMNFAYRYENDQLVIYLHSAKEGKKLDLLRKDDHVCFASAPGRGTRVTLTKRLQART